MKNEPTNYNPAGDWAFFWPSPSVVKPVAPKMSKQHTGQGVPSSALNKALVYQTGTFTIVITPCPASGCSKDSTSLQGQTHEMLAIGSEGSVLYGTCHVQQ
ncbi:MAG TPA: hypothetical protein PLG20_06175 [Candidatus Syntrophosphaera sp.]|nr:hypothetical protein [Candidatus Syntrophosphaera sp.]